MLNNSYPKSKVKFTWQQFVGIIFGIPAIAYPMEYWGYSTTHIFMFPRLSPLLATLMCAVSGTIIGFMWKGEKPFRENLLARTLTGTVFGALTIWVSDFYIYMRGNPDSMFVIEGFFATMLSLIPALLFFALITGSLKSLTPEEEAQKYPDLLQKEEDVTE